jgi:O-Antigen ligase
LVLVYLSALVLFGLSVRTTIQLRWLVVAFTAGIAVVCAVAVTSRLLPDVWPVRPNLADSRLSYPITYWNALGLLASLGIVLSLQMATQARGPRAVRALGAAAVPLLATTSYFTFSRGAILVAVLGVVVYLALARPAGALSGLIAIVPPTAIAVGVAYHADRLATTHPTTPAAVAQGNRVAWVLAACTLAAGILRVGLLGLDDRAPRISPPRVSRGVVAAIAAGTIAALVAVALAVGAAAWIGRQYDRFANASPVSEPRDLRTRLTQVSSTGRVQLWDVASHEFSTAPIIGQGAGTFELAWERERPFPATDVNAHSLYVEVLEELGLVGFLLLATTLAAILVGLAVRIRGEARALYAAVFAAALMWALHAGFDWDWQMPAATLSFFALGAAAIAAERSEARIPSAGTWIPIRLAAAVPIVLLCAFPFKVVDSQASLDRADRAFASRDCAAASGEARTSIAALGARPEPYELLGYCAIRAGHPQSAIVDMQQAIDRDPDNWNFHYGLGLARAAAGIDPVAELRGAHRLDPREPLIRQALRRLTAGGAQASQRRASQLARAFTSL